MANIKSLAKDTAIYGLSSIIGRFLNYLLVPVYTAKMTAASGSYGIITNMYALTALILVLLTFGMETTFFRFANKEGEDPRRVFSTALIGVMSTSSLFFLAVVLFLMPVSEFLGYASHPQYVWVMALTVSIDAVRAIPFVYLRLQQKALKFASLQLLNIGINIVLNLVYYIVLGGHEPGYAFYINLVCSFVITLCLYKEIGLIRSGFDMSLMRRMIRYSWPLVVFGITGILNQVADKILFPFVYKEPDMQTQLGIYGACVKIAMIMAMITQAFRYAYEPFVFSKTRDKDNNETQAVAMKYFLIFTLLAFLCVVGWLDILKYILSSDYWVGLQVVPIVMVAEIMMGIYFNLSFWYKLNDRTIWGAVFSGVGCVLLITVNVVFIPRYGYMACAWGGVVGYGSAMLLSYFVGQTKYPIRYPLKSIAVYVAIAVVFTAVMYAVPAQWPLPLRLGINTVLICLFVGHIISHDLPLASLPVVGKYFRRH